MKKTKEVDLEQETLKQMKMEAYTGDTYKYKKNKKIVALSLLGVVAGLTTASIGARNGNDRIYKHNSWNKAFANKENATNYIDDDSNYSIEEIGGEDYYYIASAGSISNLVTSGKKEEESLFINSMDELKAALIKDINSTTVNLDGHLYNGYAQSYWVPLLFNDTNKEGIWIDTTNANRTDEMYGGNELTKYYKGIDNADNTKTKTYNSVYLAASSMINFVGGTTYSYDSQNFNTLDDMYTHFQNNNVTYSDLNKYIGAKPYNATNGSNITLMDYSDTNLEAKQAFLSNAKTYERTLIKNKVWTEIDYQTTNIYSQLLNSWIANNAVSESGAKWIDWAQTVSLSSFLNGDKKYLDGVSSYSWNARNIWTGSSSDSSLWRAFRAAEALGRKLFDSEYATGVIPQNAYTCTNGDVTLETQFIKDFKALWNDFGLERARPFDTEVKKKLCENNDPIYNEKSSSSGRGWKEDFWFSNWLTSRLPVIVGPKGTPSYTPTESEFRQSATYVSKFNEWKNAQDGLNNKVWNSTTFDSYGDALNALNAYVDVTIDNTYIKTDILKKAEWNYPSEAAMITIISSTATKLNDLVQTKFYNDKRWTTIPAGNVSFKTGVNWNNLGIDISKAPSTASYTNYMAFLESNILSKYGKPGESHLSYDGIIEFNNDKTSKYIVYKNFNNSSYDIFHKYEVESEEFDEYLWNNKEAFKLLAQTQKTKITKKIVLNIDHSKKYFDTIDEAKEYWNKELYNE